MGVNPISTVTFSKRGRDFCIEKAFTSGRELQTTNIVLDALDYLNISTPQNYSLKVFEDKIKLFEIVGGKEEELKCFINKHTTEKIINAFQRQLENEKVANPISKPKIDQKNENRIKKAIVNFLDLFFRKEIIHAKMADILTLALFVTICTMSAIAFFHPGALAALHIFNINVLPYINLGFGVTTLLVGNVLFYQSILNYQKAKKSQDKTLMRLALMQAAFSVVIMGLGTTGVLGFFNISNQTVFRALLGMCSSYMFGYGIYNLMKTIELRKKLNEKDLDLEQFLKEKLQVQDDEEKEISQKIQDLKDDINKIDQWLKNILSKEKFDKIKEESLAKKIERILSIERKMLQKRKISHFESILGKNMINKCNEFLAKSKDEKNEQKEALKKEINRALKKKLIAESVRISSPILGLGAFGFNLDYSLNLFSMSKNLESMIYYAMMFFSVGITTPLNYSKKDRNVPIEEDEEIKKSSSFQDHLKPSISVS